MLLPQTVDNIGTVSQGGQDAVVGSGVVVAVMPGDEQQPNTVLKHALHANLLPNTHHWQAAEGNTHKKALSKNTLRMELCTTHFHSMPGPNHAANCKSSRQKADTPGITSATGVGRSWCAALARSTWSHGQAVFF